MEVPVHCGMINVLDAFTIWWIIIAANESVMAIINLHVWFEEDR